MADVQHRNTNDASETTNAKKRKGFWSNLLGRSSKATTADEKKDDQEPKKKGGFMNSLADNARQAATREVAHVAEHEAMKEAETWYNNNNNGSQPTDTNTTTANSATGTSTITTTTPSDALNAPTNWAKRMADSAQQKIQGLQNMAS